MREPEPAAWQRCHTGSTLRIWPFYFFVCLILFEVRQLFSCSTPTDWHTICSTLLLLLLWYSFIIVEAVKMTIALAAMSTRARITLSLSACSLFRCHSLLVVQFQFFFFVDLVYSFCCFLLFYYLLKNFACHFFFFNIFFSVCLFSVFCFFVCLSPFSAAVFTVFPLLSHLHYCSCSCQLLFALIV